MTAVMGSFGSDASEVGRARHFLLGQFGEQDDETKTALALMLSELATNAVLHGQSGFDVAIHVSPNGRWVRIEVTDGGGGLPVTREVRPEDPSGRGLGIVKNLADDWGVFIHPDKSTKTVWYSMRLGGPHGSLSVDPDPIDRQSPFGASVSTLERRDGASKSDSKWPEHDVRLFLDRDQRDCARRRFEGNHPLRQCHGRGTVGMAPSRTGRSARSRSIAEFGERIIQR